MQSLSLIAQLILILSCTENVTKWTKEVSRDDKELEKLKKEESKQMKVNINLNMVKVMYV